MSLLLVTLLLAAAPIADPHGFTFEVPDGFTAFPGFKPAGNKLYAFGKNLGTQEAITLTLDAADVPVNAGSPSESCVRLMKSIDRTVGGPTTEQWRQTQLSGSRMVMEHVFGQVVVLCVDVPVKPNAVTLMVSGKPSNEPALRATFEKTLSSISTPEEKSSWEVPLLVAAPLSVIFLFFFVRRVRASRSSR